MNDFEIEVKAVYEALAKRPLSDAEVADIALTLRQLAAFLIECGQDEELCRKLGLPTRNGADNADARPRVAPRAVDNTTPEGGNAVRELLLAETDPPTAPLRDALPHRDSSASLASATPAGTPAASLLQHTTTGATVDGSS